jgi:hypothetical protein
MVWEEENMNLEKKLERLERRRICGSLYRRMEVLERRVAELEKWRRNKEESERVMERYTRAFSLREEDLQKLKRLIEKKRRELTAGE